jgi:peptidoglycan/LPS O-acetylase OafA/YrhL
MAQLAVIYLNTEVLGLAWNSLRFTSALESSFGISFVDPKSALEIALRFTVFFVSLLLVSSLSYYGIEKPCREASRRWARQPRLVAP